MEIAETVRTVFKERFGSVPESVAVAPGRLELLGNHTDYNEGLVLGLAIDRHIAVAGRRTGGDAVEIYSQAFNSTESCIAGEIRKNPAARWADYPKGVIDQLVKAGMPRVGFQLAICSAVPLGAGVSSSAALLVATAYCLQRLFGMQSGKMATAKLCHAAERDFAGANNGLLDHFCSVFGKAGHALYLDCRTNDYEAIPISSSDLAVAVCQTNVKHSIVEGEYQARRKQCAAAAAFFRRKKNTVRTLRDVTSHDLGKWGNEMEPVLLKRAHHIVGENERVAEGKALLKKGDLGAFGNLLYASHESSFHNFENSCLELDVMVDIARSIPGVWGARLTGGGFGGCALVFVQRSSADALRAAVFDQYPEKTGKTPEIFFCAVSDGAYTAA